MEIYKIENLTFSYLNRKKYALKNINLTVSKGDFVIVCGASGCGKTTLLRQLKPQLSEGLKSGEIYFDGVNLANLSKRETVEKIGFVSQSPNSQIVTDKVWHELAFGLESLGYKTEEIRLRVAETASFFGIQEWFHKSVTELSGGQKQLLVLASIMAMQPSVLILDEPTSQLDPIAAGEFISMIAKINRELGVTIILSEHRLEEVFCLSSHVAVMEEGRILTKGTPYQVGLYLRNNHNMFLAMPVPMRVWAACEKNGDCPITVRDGANWLAKQTFDETCIPKDIPESALTPAVTFFNCWFKYEKNMPDIIKGLNFTAYYGEISAVLGGNGTGKTTMLSLISKINVPYRGKIILNESAYVLPQDPQALFTAKTVLEDLHEISKDETGIKAVTDLCRLNGLLDYHPYDLSGGEQQRAALAKLLLLQPKILLLDEPTKGLDADFKRTFADILRTLKSSGTAIIMVSHDIEFCSEHSDKCALFFDGGIVTENTSRNFFCGNSFYTTAANRMARNLIPRAITASDIINALKGNKEKTAEIRHAGTKPENIAERSISESKPNGGVGKKSFLSKILRLNIAAAIFLMTIPATICLGLYFFDNRNFYLISVLIILQTMLPFVLIFEERKPKARELVIIAVLCSVAVAGRVAFFMLPQFKPVLAVVIISGVVLGGEAGFLIGAMTAFVSNIYFGQGPWTPWQMFAFGIIGFLGGILFRKGALNRSPISLAVFGGTAAFFIYGGIMNPASILISQPSPTLEMFILAFLHGLSFDIVHALATVIFLAVISRSMLEKLDRVRVKYGLID